MALASERPPGECPSPDTETLGIALDLGGEHSNGPANHVAPQTSPASDDIPATETAAVPWPCQDPPGPQAIKKFTIPNPKIAYL